MLSIISWVVVGLIAGALAKLIMPGDDPGGILVTIVIGIVGAMVGGWVGQLLGFGGAAAAGSFSFIGIIWAVIGGLILLGLYRFVMSKMG